MARDLKPTPRVLIISNQQTVTGSLSYISLQQQKYNVILETKVAKAVERWAEETPDLIILDVNFPKNLILLLIKALREETATPILLVTKNLSEDDMLEAYDAGADDCLAKPVSPSIYLAKIRVWLRHSPTVNADSLEPLKAGTIHLLPSDRTITIGKNQPIRLTNLELRLIYTLMSRPKHTVSTEELIKQVWGGDGAGDATMLKNLIYRIRQKIELNPINPIIIRTVTGQGYTFSS